MLLPEPIRRGVEHFNAGEYFEAHEAWEGHWGRGPPAERALTMGLIKAAVALLHLTAGNEAGFLWQAEKAIPRLRENGAIWPELDVAALGDALESLASQWRFHGHVPPGTVLPLVGEHQRTSSQES
ncbi:MAG: DUF309 domain-containing protein [Candidatus Thermoplasmatota archaeon]